MKQDEINKLPNETTTKKVKWLHHHLWKYYISKGYTSYEAKMIAWELLDKYNFDDNGDFIEDDNIVVSLEDLIKKPKR